MKPHCWTNTVFRHCRQSAWSVFLDDQMLSNAILPLLHSIRERSYLLKTMGGCRSWVDWVSCWCVDDRGGEQHNGRWSIGTGPQDWVSPHMLIVGCWLSIDYLKYVRYGSGIKYALSCSVMTVRMTSFLRGSNTSLFEDLRRESLSYGSTPKRYLSGSCGGDYSPPSKSWWAFWSYSCLGRRQFRSLCGRQGVYRR